MVHCCSCRAHTSIKEIEIYRSDGKVYPEVTCEFQTGTDDIKHSMQFNVYPNPADNLIYIDIGRKYVDTLDIMITDITSKVCNPLKIML
jgi:hypothetical protein